MKIFSAILILLTASTINYKDMTANPPGSEIPIKYKEIAEKIINRARADSMAWERLAYMCDTFGPRLSGSAGLEKALDWIYGEMLKDGFANVRKEPVMVPHWQSGKEYCRMTSPRWQDFPMLSLGGSIATPPEGIEAPVLVVDNKEELFKRAGEAKGRIVVFNNQWDGYGKTVQYRTRGAQWAAKAGAVASLIRSVSPIGMKVPHTGMMRYDDSIPKIPHAAITAEDVAMLKRMQKRGQSPVLKLYMEAKMLPDAQSYNVMGEIRGTELPDEIVAIGGHIDSWHTGLGAHDDGGGCIATWEVVKLLNELGLKPRRTVRAVMWTNEENGVRGGKAYAEAHKDEKHHLLFEFDSGIFPPKAIRYTGPEQTYNILQHIEPLLQMVNDSMKVTKGGWGVDIRPLADLNKIPIMSIGTEDKGRYFWYHHAPTDTPDKVDPKLLNDCIAVIAIAVYIYADMP